MGLFGEQLEKRRQTNAKALKAFGATASNLAEAGSSHLRTIRTGGKTTIFTIGYEKRSGDELISLLRDAGVEVLADIREKPMSRVPDFRQSSLRGLCEAANILYEGWPELGSTEGQRSRLKETADFKTFARQFRSYATRSLSEPLDRLAKRSKAKSVALLCYERLHEECHRSIVADLLADRLDATVVAI